MSVHAVIPYTGRSKVVLHWALERYERAGIPVNLAPGGKTWCKAEAVTPAVEELPEDSIAVVADADAWCHGIGRAIAAVEADERRWAMPHRHVHRISRKGTKRVLAGDWSGRESLEEHHQGVAGGGIVIASRETLLDCPLDPRFVGWGCEDVAWGMALTTLHGPAWRGSEALWHLWHPPQARPDRLTGSPESEALRRRYAQAVHKRQSMRDLIEEAK